MLKLRLTPSVDHGSVNIAYVASPSYDTESSVSFLDMSREEPGNQVIIGDRLVNTYGEIPTSDVLVSNVAVLRRDQTNPKSLYYRYTIGRGRFVVMLDGLTSSDAKQAHQRLLSSLRFIQHDGQLASVNWWISEPTWSSPGWVVTVYTDRKNDEDQTIWVQYDGWDTTLGVPARGKKEIVNSVVLSTTVSVNLSNLNNADHLKFTVTAGSTNDYAPGIGLFPNITGCPAVVVSAGNFQIADSPTVNITIGANRSIRDLVSAINSSTTKLTAVALNDGLTSNLVHGTYDIDGQINGVVLRMDAKIQVRFDSNARIRAAKPYPGQVYESWYPRIKAGYVLQDWSVVTQNNALVANAEVHYSIPEFSTQAWSPVYGQPFKSVVSEYPFVLDPYTIRTRRSNLRSYDDVSVFLFGYETDAIEDIDLESGTIFLSTRIDRREDITVDYTYRELWYEYKGLDLNVLPNFNPDMLGKYVCLYLTPSYVKVETSNAVLLTDRCVWHVYGESISDAVERATNTVFYQNTDYGTLKAPVFILGIYRVVQNRDYREASSIVDSRQFGGGFSPNNVDYRQAPEALMVSDLAQFDGKPFPVGNILIADLEDIRRATVTGYPSVVDGVTGTLWSSATGRLLEEEIVDYLHRYPAAGTLVIHEYDLEYPI